MSREAVRSDLDPVGVEPTSGRAVWQPLRVCPLLGRGTPSNGCNFGRSGPPKPSAPTPLVQGATGSTPLWLTRPGRPRVYAARA